jgi:hypothetical protein
MWRMVNMSINDSQSSSNCTDLPFWGKKWQNQEACRLIDCILLPQWRQETTPSCPRDLYVCGEWLTGVWEAHNCHQMAQISHFEHFAKQHLGDDKKRLICSISCDPTPTRTHQQSLWTHMKGRKPSGARGDAKMAVILARGSSPSSNCWKSQIPKRVRKLQLLRKHQNTHGRRSGPITALDAFDDGSIIAAETIVIIIITTTTNYNNRAS